MSGKQSRVIFLIVALLIIAIGWALFSAVQHARHAARLMTAYGHLNYMRMALCNYEIEHGTLPPLCLRDEQGKPVHSWRALVLPYLEKDSFGQLDLSQPWNSTYNRNVVEGIPPREWTLFARDVGLNQLPASTCILALLGTDSIWDPATGLPKGTFEEKPDAILLISVPESTIDPLEPRDITEKEVLAIIKDGKEVLFIKAGVRDGYGIVRSDHGTLVFTSR